MDDSRAVLVTGGAGFIGANVAVALAERHPDWSVSALDNLKRRGSELNLPRLRASGVEFIHGDIRFLADLETGIGPIDVIVECSAEPSVMAGVDGSPDYLIGSNLIGAYNCLELARRHQAAIIFLSTSRVYPVQALAQLRLEETETRFELAASQPVPGASSAGISEAFPLNGARTLYGATKLSAELLLEEYRETYDIQAVVNRCGVVAGAWQMGKVDQGIFTYWMLAHHFGRPLRYIGYDGSGKQVRDLLHIDDLVDLIDLQINDLDHWDGAVCNVGGGRDVSLSLLEATALCAEISGRHVEVERSTEQRAGDIPIYISDCGQLENHSSWRPRRDAATVLDDIHRWVVDHERAIAAAL